MMEKNIAILLIVVLFTAGILCGFLIGGSMMQNKWIEYDNKRGVDIVSNCDCNDFGKEILKSSFPKAVD